MIRKPQKISMPILVSPPFTPFLSRMSALGSPQSTRGSPQSSSRRATSRSPDIADISPLQRPSLANLPTPLAPIHPTIHHANTAPCIHVPPCSRSRKPLALSPSPPSRPASLSTTPLDIVLLPSKRSARPQSRSMHDATLPHDGDPPAIRRRSQPRRRLALPDVPIAAPVPAAVPEPGRPQPVSAAVRNGAASCGAGRGDPHGARRLGAPPAAARSQTTRAAAATASALAAGLPSVGERRTERRGGGRAATQTRPWCAAARQSGRLGAGPDAGLAGQ